jgi:hypothetical protein
MNLSSLSSLSEISQAQKDKLHESKNVEFIEVDNKMVVNCTIDSDENILVKVQKISVRQEE